MKKLLYIFALATIVLSACGKDDPINPEKVLFKRLSADGGVWTIEKIEHYTISNGNETLDSTYYRDRQYVFYEHSEVFDYAQQMDLSYLAVAVLNKDQGGVRYALWAEGERIIFEDFGVVLGPQYTFTVRENKKHNQVWEVYDTNPFERTVIYLKHCPNCEPYYPIGQLNSI